MVEAYRQISYKMLKFRNLRPAERITRIDPCQSRYIGPKTAELFSQRLFALGVIRWSFGDSTTPDLRAKTTPDPRNQAVFRAGADNHVSSEISPPIRWLAHVGQRSRPPSRRANIRQLPRLLPNSQVCNVEPLDTTCQVSDINIQTIK
jgi:hypothetical protein